MRMLPTSTRSVPKISTVKRCPWRNTSLTDKNYAQLQELYTTYAGQGLNILAFPCNQFGHQEPGTNAEIKANALNKYHATFEFFAKCDVNGSNALPLFKYLQTALPGTLTK
ncbi:unnamed protein product [Dibothriocephalus latus]|uniref:Glutathione peroxidase n=1 Tax=Dibothriocephalus latus TaxID=60516 RepID=A0A3P6QFD6_DIBLA|nr:unnamed protein product [Dibothriocephalus latus]